MADAKEQGPSRASTYVKDILLVALVLVVATSLALAVSLMSVVPTAQSSRDFTLEVSPSSNSTTPGNATSTTVTAAVTSAMSAGVIQFSCATLPLGANCTFTPSSCRPTCSADLALSTSASTPPGTHVVTIGASDGNVSRTATFQLSLSAPSPPPPFDFSLGIDPASGFVIPGGHVSTNVTATLRTGPTRAVQYSCSDLPPGTMCMFLLPSCSPTCNSTLTLATSTNTPAGTYQINVTASDGSVTRTIPYALTVQRVPPVKTLIFREGDGKPFSHTDDATLYSGRPNGNYGTDPLLVVDGARCIANGTVCRSVVSFPNFLGPDDGQVPSNVTLVSATLEFNVTNDGPSQRLYQVQEAWNESTVTWNTFATPGTPRTKGPTILYNATWGRIVVNITGIVQNWVRGDPNYGVFMRSDSGNKAEYRSSESISPPTLTVTFRTGGSPRAVGGSPVTPGTPSSTPMLWAAHGGFGVVAEKSLGDVAIWRERLGRIGKA